MVAKSESWCNQTYKQLMIFCYLHFYISKRGYNIKIPYKISYWYNNLNEKNFPDHVIKELYDYFIFCDDGNNYLCRWGV